MKKLLFFSLFLLITFFYVSFAMAEGTGPAVGSGSSGGKSEPVTLTNPLGTGVTPQIFIGRIIKAILGIVGSLALVMFVYGGFNIMTAAGTAEKVEKGKQILVWATIGLIVIFTPVKYRAVVDSGQEI